MFRYDEEELDVGLDFVHISVSERVVAHRGGATESIVKIVPEYRIMLSNDLMIKGGAFYAVWDSDAGMWSKDSKTVCRIVDAALERLSKDPSHFEGHETIEVSYLRDFSSNKWSEFIKYCGSLPDNFHELDTKLTFSDQKCEKDDYVSKRLSYSMGAGPTHSWDELVGTLYDPIEKQKLEWAIGSIFAGDSVWIQKFIVLYGSAGTGKSTVLNIVQQLFDGYYNTFEAKALASFNNSFALEMFRDNPLVSIQHDGDLSRIEDNTKLNSIVSHEEMVVNEKRKSQYTARFNTFIFMGTNKPVSITDAKSGILRRLIDVRPSGNKVGFGRYQTLMSRVKFELGAIAYRCFKVYQQLGATAYDQYVPTEMMGATNDFYNFVEDNFDILGGQEGVTLAVAWKNYRIWCDEAEAKYTKSKRAFKEELKNYFSEFKERGMLDGTQCRNVYYGFKKDKFRYSTEAEELKAAVVSTERLVLDSDVSPFDVMCRSYPAQYANADGTPSQRWSNVNTQLKDILTSELHYVKLPENHIVIDFDLKDDDGEKSLELNLKAAAKWPKTYAEVSKSGKGVHLHYFYEGDTAKLSNSYSEGIEIKVFKGNSSLRRKLTRCNREEIAVLSSGLPSKKGGKKVMDFEGLKNEKALRTTIERNLRKEIHPGTKPSVDFIFKVVEDAYKDGMKYDITDMRPAIMAFANNSTHHSYYCIKLVSQMHYHSDEEQPAFVEWDEGDKLIFYDVEVFPNLFIVVWKYEDADQCVRMVNPTPVEIEQLCRFKLVGFNNRRYDNHILYGRMLGMSNEELYALSKRIVNNDKSDKNCFFKDAWSLSYTDIYDYASVKMGLKKWEIKLGVHHEELGLPWDQPVDESLWEKVARYCENDVRATESVFKATFDDFTARLLLSELSGLTANDTTRQHMTRIIFGGDKNARDKLVYTDLSEMFPGYVFDCGKSTYRGEEVGEGGYVYAEPGYYEEVALLDIASMHPNSLIQLNYFGPYTHIFQDLVNARLAIKHGDHDAARNMMDGKLAKFIDDPNISDKKLAYALKIAINSVYGYTCARFDCEFKHPSNIDNIVAKRGALFMIDLKNEVQKRGFTVAHIKTDSIKIPNATPEIISFVQEFGKKYGYTFEHEDTYDRMCLVNDAVYIAKSREHGTWEATGTQFAVPYVFKTLFSHEDLIFDDYCETKTVSVGDLYLDMANDQNDPDLKFVGRAGLFTPILPGRGGGTLYRVANDKLYAAAGTKGYEWLESEKVKLLDKQDDIDVSYYERMCAEAIKTIEAFVSYEKLTRKE